jgi:hypothetical protein
MARACNLDQQGLNADYKRVLASFVAIAQIKSPTEQRFRLIRIAAFHDIPRSEFRAMFKSWQMERRVQGGKQQ